MLLGGANDTAAARPVRAAAEGLRARHSGAQLLVLEAGLGAPDEAEYAALLAGGALALEAAAPHVSRDALLLLLPPHAEFNQDFLNRVSSATSMCRRTPVRSE